MWYYSRTTGRIIIFSAAFLFSHFFFLLMTIGVFFGSRSPEHDVSIITGQVIIAGLKKIGVEAEPVYLDKNGGWFIGKELGAIEFFQKPDAKTRLKKFGGWEIDLDESVTSTKLVFRKKGWIPRRVAIDLAFPAFHGAYGEDGTAQGFFEILNVPYIGCDAASSAVAMDKVITKLLYASQNIPTAKFISFSADEWRGERSGILNDANKNLRYPVFVKPARLGSSIGIAKVMTPKELEFAIEVALHYDSKALIEEGVENLMDVTCCVLGNENPKPSLLQESAFSGEFFSYKDKYLNEGGAQLGKAEKSIVIPARLDPETAKAIQNMAVRIFKLFGCSGIARVDFLYDKAARKFYANEINTLPGTLYHHLWKASGIEFGDLLRELIKLARERRESKEKLTSTFDSEILSKVNSPKFISAKMKV